MLDETATEDRLLQMGTLVNDLKSDDLGKMENAAYTLSRTVTEQAVEKLSAADLCTGFCNVVGRGFVWGAEELTKNGVIRTVLVREGSGVSAVMKRVCQENVTWTKLDWLGVLSNMCTSHHVMPPAIRKETLDLAVNEYHSNTGSDWGRRDCRAKAMKILEALRDDLERAPEYEQLCSELGFKPEDGGRKRKHSSLEDTQQATSDYHANASTDLPLSQKRQTTLFRDQQELLPLPLSDSQQVAVPASGLTGTDTATSTLHLLQPAFCPQPSTPRNTPSTSLGFAHHTADSQRPLHHPVPATQKTPASLSQNTASLSQQRPFLEAKQNPATPIDYRLFASSANYEDDEELAAWSPESPTGFTPVSTVPHVSVSVTPQTTEFSTLEIPVYTTQYNPSSYTHQNPVSITQHTPTSSMHGLPVPITQHTPNSSTGVIPVSFTRQTLGFTTRRITASPVRPVPDSPSSDHVSALPVRYEDDIPCVDSTIDDTPGIASVDLTIGSQGFTSRDGEQTGRASYMATTQAGHKDRGQIEQASNTGIVEARDHRHNGHGRQTINMGRMDGKQASYMGTMDQEHRDVGRGIQASYMVRMEEEYILRTNATRNLQDQQRRLEDRIRELEDEQRRDKESVRRLQERNRQMDEQERDKDTISNLQDRQSRLQNKVRRLEDILRNYYDERAREAQEKLLKYREKVRKLEDDHRAFTEKSIQLGERADHSNGDYSDYDDKNAALEDEYSRPQNTTADIMQEHRKRTELVGHPKEGNSLEDDPAMEDARPQNMRADTGQEHRQPTELVRNSERDNLHIEDDNTAMEDDDTRHQATIPDLGRNHRQRARTAKNRQSTQEAKASKGNNSRIKVLEDIAGPSHVEEGTDGFKPKAGVYTQSDARKHGMIPLTSGRDVYLYKPDLELAVNSSKPGDDSKRPYDGTRLGRRLLNIFFSKEERRRGSIAEEPKAGLVRLDKTITEAIIVRCRQLDPTTTRGKVRDAIASSLSAERAAPRRKKGHTMRRT